MKYILYFANRREVLTSELKDPVPEVSHPGVDAGRVGLRAAAPVGNDAVLLPAAVRCSGSKQPHQKHATEQEYLVFMSKLFLLKRIMYGIQEDCPPGL